MEEYPSEKETVMVLHDRVQEAQRLAVMELREQEDDKTKKRRGGSGQGRGRGSKRGRK